MRAREMAPPRVRSRKAWELRPVRLPLLEERVLAFLRFFREVVEKSRIACQLLMTETHPAQANPAEGDPSPAEPDTAEADAEPPGPALRQAQNRGTTS